MSMGSGGLEEDAPRCHHGVPGCDCGGRQAVIPVAAPQVHGEDSAAIRALRRLLWLRHGCDGLYGDDGEMQCARCGIDFRRDEPTSIDERFFAIALMKQSEGRPG